MNTNDYAEANRQAWNEAAAIHAAHNWAALLEQFAKPGHSCLHKPQEVERLRALQLAGKNVIQLCCNNGRELISVKNLFAAGRCVGVDISDDFVEQAKTLNAVAGQDVEFVRSSVFELPTDLNAQFDLVYITVGALGWLPDLKRFWRVLRGLLKPGGQVLIYEMHPVMGMFDNDEATKANNPFELRHSYFKRAPFEDSQGLDYYGGTAYASKTMYWFQHTLADVIGGLAREGLRITAFEEFEFDIANSFGHLEHFALKLPMCYLLEARLD